MLHNCPFMYFFTCFWHFFLLFLNNFLSFSILFLILSYLNLFISYPDLFSHSNPIIFIVKFDWFSLDMWDHAVQWRIRRREKTIEKNDSVVHIIKRAIIKTIPLWLRSTGIEERVSDGGGTKETVLRHEWRACSYEMSKRLEHAQIW